MSGTKKEYAAFPPLPLGGGLPGEKLMKDEDPLSCWDEKAGLTEGLWLDHDGLFGFVQVLL